MNSSIYRPYSYRLAGFGLGLIWLSACSSLDEVPGGGRVEHPTEPRPLVAPSASMASSASPIASASASTGLPQERRRTPSESYEETTGIKLSEADKAIMDDCPQHALSKNVPKRACANDEQCGDGFCDRGHCAAIWTCNLEYGQRCEEPQRCGAYYVCVDGRCRSCISDSECNSSPSNRDPKCVSDSTIFGSSSCVGKIPRSMGSTTPWPRSK